MCSRVPETSSRERSAPPLGEIPAGLLEEVPLEFEVTPFFKKHLLDLYVYVLSKASYDCILGNGNELGLAPGGFWGCGLLG